MKKIKLSCEATYFLSLIILSFSVCLTTAADLGISMIVAPSYLVSLKFTFLTFGQAEYVMQGLLFILFCILMKRVKLSYFLAFLTSVIYGSILDLWRLLPLFDPAVTVPGSMTLPVRIILFAVGMVLCAFSIALCFRTYVYPQVVDFFVKGVAEKYNLNRNKFKIIYDFSFLAIGVILSFIFFGKLRALGIGTVVLVCLNGVLIAFFGKILDKYFEFFARSKKLEHFFEIT